ATMEYEAESDGTLLQILVAEGETAAIGTPIARVGEPGEAAEPQSGSPSPPAARGPRVNASPIAKRPGQERGGHLAPPPGTGPNGMITKEDVERAAGEGAGGPAADAPAPLSRVQQAVARHMVEAAAVPTFALEVEIDMTAASELRESLDPKPSFNDLVVKACG